MGGYGSGRWGLHIRAARVEDIPLQLELDRTMARHIRAGGGLYSVTWKPRHTLLGQRQESSITYAVVEGGGAIRLQYRNVTTGQEVDERVAVVSAQLRYGQRLFWQCPGCSRRAALLYYRGSNGMPGFLSRQPGRFRCRQCHGLTYRSCHESDGRISAMLRQYEENPEAATAALHRMIDVGNLHNGLLMLKALDRLHERRRRELRKLGIKIPPLLGLG
jgi:hypothetical protein